MLATRPAAKPAGRDEVIGSNNISTHQSDTHYDLIAPSSLEIHSSYFRIGTQAWLNTLCVRVSPRTVHRVAVIDHQYRLAIDISMFAHLVDTGVEA